MGNVNCCSKDKELGVPVEFVLPGVPKGFEDAEETGGVKNQQNQVQSSRKEEFDTMQAIDSGRNNITEMEQSIQININGPSIDQDKVLINFDEPDPVIAKPIDLIQSISQQKEYITDLILKTLNKIGNYIPKVNQQYSSNVTLGPYIFENGSIYVGQWKSGKREGYGKITGKDGSIYEGEWFNDVYNGQGRLIHVGGDVYEGQFKDNKAQGTGKYIHTDGNIYEGEWLDDQQHGQGAETWADGSKYVGAYQFNKKHGKGVFLWADQSKYEGEFENNFIQGKGVLIWPDGRRYEGQYQGNLCHGRGIFTWADGKVYDGEYANDKREGYGEFKWPEGKLYKGQWKEGLQHGEGTIIKGDKVATGVWENGQRVKWLDEASAKQE